MRWKLLNSYEHEKTAQLASISIGLSTLGGNDQMYDIGAGRFTYGQIIALSGDYIDKFEDLSTSNPIDLYLTIGSRVYQKDSHMDWNWILNQPTGYLSYLLLATKNPEHFRGSPQIIAGNYVLDPNSDDSVTAYIEGHKSAMDHGIKASNNSDLRTAYAINAFYDHFMTDMFSASHLRVPRRQLHDKYGIGDMYTAAQMHNEDGKYGLWVTNALGDVWQAFGDGEQQTNSSNADNWQRCLQAVKASVDEVKNAITTKSVIATTDYQILKIKPEVFPPGAVVYSKSKKTDYTVKMEVEDANPWPIQCVVMEFPSKQKALVIPKWLKDKTDPELPDLVVWLRGFDDDNIENILKPLYRINTKSVVSPSGDMKGTQSYPLFIIADGKLYVRTTDDISSPLANQYITAEYNYDNTTLYDSNSAPAVTERLQGRQQGYPAPP